MVHARHTWSSSEQILFIIFAGMALPNYCEWLDEHCEILCSPSINYTIPIDLCFLKWNDHYFMLLARMIWASCSIISECTLLLQTLNDRLDHRSRSVRHGLAHFAIGGLRGSAAILFGQNNLDVSIRHDFSTPQCENHQWCLSTQTFVWYSVDAHIVFWVQFDNRKYPIKPLVPFPSLSHLNGTTFFRVSIKNTALAPLIHLFQLQVFPFSILMDSSLCILQLGANTRKLFPIETPLVGRPLDDVFRLIRPDIHVEWNKVTISPSLSLSTLASRVDSLVRSTHRVSDGESTATPCGNIRTDSTERTNEVSGESEHAVVSVSSSVRTMTVEGESSRDAMWVLQFRKRRRPGLGWIVSERFESVR